jgi:hypothetical protein
MAPSFVRRSEIARGNAFPSISAALCAALVVALLLAADAAGDFRSNPGFRHMVLMQRGIHSSIADIEVHTKMKSFPPLSLTFHGHSYFRGPDKETVVLDDVPGPLKGIVKDTPSIEPAVEWEQYYHVTLVADDGSATTFHLVPRDSSSSLASIDAILDDTTGYMTQVHFVNTNGSETTTQQTYGNVDRFAVIVSQTGQSHGSGYKADVTTTFTNYQINVPVPDSIFTPQ